MSPGATERPNTFQRIQSDTTLPAVIPESSQTAANAPLTQLFGLTNQTVAITGGGRGLGLSLASAVVEAGGHVACLDILTAPEDTEWQRIQKLAKQSHVTVTYTRVDITDEESMVHVMEDVASTGREKQAPLNGVIACAGIQQKVSALDYPIADFERMLRVNTVGTFVTVKTAARIMVREKTPGSIVMVASMSGNIANRGLTCSAYNTSKAAVQQMARSLAQEWGQYGIRINTLSPGYIRTAMTDELLAAEPEIEKLWMAGALLGRLGAPEDFKAGTVFLLGRGSSWMTGADLRIDGGHTASA